jgi:hypothetical protein
MSLIQINLHTNSDNKYKDLYIEIKKDTTFNTIFNKIKNLLDNNVIFNLKKIVINDELYIEFDLNIIFLDFLKNNNIEYHDLDDLNIICFVDINIPNLVYNEFLTNIYIKHLIK